MTDPNSPEVVASVPTDIEAAAIVTALTAAGVEAKTEGGYTAGFRAEAPGSVAVIVRHCHREQARQILADLREHTDEIDWSQVDVGRPESM